MRVITEFSGVEFLKRCNKIRYEVEDILKKTGVMEIRKHKPVLNGNETAEEIRSKNMEQSKKNLSDILDVLLEKKPEETLRLFRLLVDLEEGEKEPTGFELVTVGMSVLFDRRVMDFLLPLMQSVA